MMMMMMDTFAMNDNECKIVLVGDSKCGKTALIHRVLHDKFLEVYVPTGFERYTAVYEVGSQRINFTVWDTAGSPAYDAVRPLAYKDAKVFLLCFQLNQRDTLENIVNKWLPEVRQHVPNVPIVLCGCQRDTKLETTDTLGNNVTLSLTHVTSEMAVDTSHDIGAATYVETSSKASGKSAREAFEVAALAALGRLNKNHGLQRDISFDTRVTLRSKSRLDLKSELKDRTKSCAVM